jgi:hypothetical protein
MPIQEIYLEQVAGLNHFQVIKSYDTAFAREAFSGMDEDALAHLSKSLRLEENFEPEDIPTSPAETPDFLWEALYDSATEDGHTRSFFIVRRSTSSAEAFLYVSGDWPSAEAYVKRAMSN